MICLTSFLYWEATGKILKCEDCPMREECKEKDGGRSMNNCETCPNAIWDCFEFYGTTKTQRIVTGCKKGMEPEECEEDEDD